MEFYINREHLLKEMEYPARYRSSNLIQTSAIIFGFILLFLLLFTPFGVNASEQKIHYCFICCLHALAPAIIIYVYFRTLDHFRKKSLPTSRWTLLREYKHIGVVLLLTGMVSFLMRDLIYYNADNWSLHYLWEEVRNCCVAGSFFYFFMRIAGFYFRSKKGSPFVLQFVPVKAEPGKTDAALVIGDS